jgi:hypothetical protein
MDGRMSAHKPIGTKNVGTAHANSAKLEAIVRTYTRTIRPRAQGSLIGLRINPLSHRQSKQRRLR